MDATVNMLFHQAEHLVLTTTNNLFDSFIKFGNSAFVIPTLLPAFLLLAVVGIQLKGICAILLMLMLFPSYILKALDVARTLADSYEPGMVKSFLEVWIDTLNAIKWNLPIFMALLGIFIFTIHWNFKHSTSFFYGFLIASYYFSELFNPDFRAYFDILAFLRILTVLPMLICIIYFKTLNDLVASLLYSFSGIWGIINLSMRLTGTYDESFLRKILDDLLYPNHLTVGAYTLYLCMVLSLCIFTQYALKSGYDSKISLESHDKENAFKKHIH